MSMCHCSGSVDVTVSLQWVYICHFVIAVGLYMSLCVIAAGLYMSLCHCSGSVDVTLSLQWVCICHCVSLQRVYICHCVIAVDL